MQIYVARHAQAVPEALGLRDEHRYLSLRGRDTARAVGRTLRERGARVEHVLTSPLVRAVQTAELLALALDFTEQLVVLPSLAPGGAPEATAQRLAGLGGAVLVVGHEPSVSGLAALLCHHLGFPAFRPAQVALVERGEPRWVLHPETLELEPLLLA